MKSCVRRDKTMPYQLTLPPPRFGEFDLGGVLYHSNYFHIYEQIREDFLSKGPYPYPKLVKSNCHLAVVESRQKFIKPIYYGEAFKAELIFSEVKRVSVTAEYRLYNENTLHLGQTKLVYIDSSAGAFAVNPLPEDLRDYFNRFNSPSQFK